MPRTVGTEQKVEAKQLGLPSAPPSNPNDASIFASPQSLVPAAASSDNAHCRIADFVHTNSKPVQQLASSKLLSNGRGRQLLNSGQPLLLQQLQLARCSLKQAMLGTQPGAQPADSAEVQLPVLCSPASSNRFITADGSKNIPGSYYHVRKLETSTLQMTFRAWLDCWQSWTQAQNRLLLQVGRRQATPV